VVDPTTLSGASYTPPQSDTEVFEDTDIATLSFTPDSDPDAMGVSIVQYKGNPQSATFEATPLGLQTSRYSVSASSRRRLIKEEEYYDELQALGLLEEDEAEVEKKPWFESLETLNELEISEFRHRRSNYVADKGEYNYDWVDSTEGVAVSDDGAIFNAHGAPHDRRLTADVREEHKLQRRLDFIAASHKGQEDNNALPRRRQRRLSSESTVDVTMVNAKEIYYYFNISSTSQNITCPAGDTAFNISVLCPWSNATTDVSSPATFYNKSFDFECSASDDGANYTFSCPAVARLPTCRTYDDSVGDFVTDTSCTLVSYTAYNTTCSCRSEVRRRMQAIKGLRKLVDAESVATSELAQYSSMASVIGGGMASTLSTAGDLSDPGAAAAMIMANLTVFITMATICCLAIFGLVFTTVRDRVQYLQWKRDKENSPERMKEKELDVDIRRFINECMPLEFTGQPWYKRYGYRLMNGHDFLSCFLPFGPNSSYSWTRFTMAIGTVINMLFVDTVLAGLFFADDGTCETHTTEELCTFTRALNQVDKMCTWAVDETKYSAALSLYNASDPVYNATVYADDYSACEFTEISEDTTSTLILVVVITLFTIPLDMLVAWLVGNSVSVFALEVENDDGVTDEMVERQLRRLKQAEQKEKRKTELERRFSQAAGLAPLTQEQLGLQPGDELYQASEDDHGHSDLGHEQQVLAAGGGPVLGTKSGSQDSDDDVIPGLGINIGTDDGSNNSGSQKLKEKEVSYKLSRKRLEITAADLGLDLEGSEDGDSRKQVGVLQKDKEEEKRGSGSSSGYKVADMEFDREGNLMGANAGAKKETAAFSHRRKKKKDRGSKPPQPKILTPEELKKKREAELENWLMKPKYEREFEALENDVGLRMMRAARITKQLDLMDNVEADEEAELLLENIEFQSLIKSHSELGNAEAPGVLHRYYDKFLAGFGSATENVGMVKYEMDGHYNGMVEKAIEMARDAADEIIDQITELESDYERQVYLFREFIVGNMPGHIQQLSRDYMFADDGIVKMRLPKPGIGGYLSVFFLICYFFFCCFYVFLFGVNLGSKATSSWLSGAGFGFIQDVMLIAPFQIFLVNVVMAHLASRRARIVQGCIREHARGIITRRVGIMRTANDLVHHFNPACRAARRFPELSIARLLISVNDHDVPAQWLGSEQRSDDPVFIQFIVWILMVLVLMLIILIIILPSDFKDLVIEVAATVFISGALYVVLLMYEQVWILPVAVVVSLCCLGACYQYRKQTIKASNPVPWKILKEIETEYDEFVEHLVIRELEFVYGKELHELFTELEDENEQEGLHFQLFLYRGDKNDEEEAHGLGIGCYQDKSVYEGTYYRNMRHHGGKVTYRDGSSYAGQWFNDFPHGPGVHRDKFGDILYKGEYHNGVPKRQWKQHQVRHSLIVEFSKPMKPVDIDEVIAKIKAENMEADQIHYDVMKAGGTEKDADKAVAEHVHQVKEDEKAKRHAELMLLEVPSSEHPSGKERDQSEKSTANSFFGNFAGIFANNQNDDSGEETKDVRSEKKKETTAEDEEDQLYRENIADYNAMSAINNYDFEDLDDVKDDTKIKADGSKQHIRMEEVKERNALDKTRTERVLAKLAIYQDETLERVPHALLNIDGFGKLDVNARLLNIPSKGEEIPMPLNVLTKKEYAIRDEKKRLALIASDYIHPEMRVEALKDIIKAAREEAAQARADSKSTGNKLKQEMVISGMRIDMDGRVINPQLHTVLSEEERIAKAEEMHGRKHGYAAYVRHNDLEVQLSDSDDSTVVENDEYYRDIAAYYDNFKQFETDQFAIDEWYHNLGLEDGADASYVEAELEGLEHHIGASTKLGGDFAGLGEEEAYPDSSSD